MAVSKSAPSPTVVVTEGGTAIGQVVSSRIASLGWSVAIGRRRPDRISDTVPLAAGRAAPCIAHQLGVSDGGPIERLSVHTEAEFGPISAVVNNAATARNGLLGEMASRRVLIPNVR